MTFNHGWVVGGVYVAWASQGCSGVEVQFSMAHVAPAWHPMVQPPAGQLRIVHVAPVAHWILQGPLAQLSITQVAPAEQCLMKHPIWQLSTVQLDPGPYSSMEHPPVAHEPSLQVAPVPSHFM